MLDKMLPPDIQKLLVQAERNIEKFDLTNQQQHMRDIVVIKLIIDFRIALFARLGKAANLYKDAGETLFKSMSRRHINAFNLLINEMTAKIEHRFAHIAKTRKGYLDFYRAHWL